MPLHSKYTIYFFLWGDFFFGARPEADLGSLLTFVSRPISNRALFAVFLGVLTGLDLFKIESNHSEVSADI